MSLQEKFQITVPAKEETGPDTQWVTQESQRCIDGTPGWTSSNGTDMDGRKFNYPAPGMDVSNQRYAEINQMPMSLAGTTDVSRDTNPQSLAQGFTKREMKGCDDQYTGEHVDHFYGDAGGFVERNNYLDRE